MKNKRRGSDQYSLCCNSAMKERTSKAQFDCCVQKEVEESDSVGDETDEETFEIRQKHRRHVNSV